MDNGSLTFNDYKTLLDNKIIISKTFNLKQIQPSSIDLSLSNEGYEISSSFLSSNGKVKKKLNNFIKKKINIENGIKLKRNKTYLFKLNEKINLKRNLFGKCNPKSSTGRLDIFCRTIFDYCNEYENIPVGYSGNMYLEVTSRAFNIFIKAGESLNQMRIIKNNHNYLNDKMLLKFNKSNPIVFNSSNIPINPEISQGLKISVDLNDKNKISAYQAKNNAPTLFFEKIKKHRISDFWKPIKAKNNSILINPGSFYILKSKEKIKIPKSMAGEMIPYDTAIGDFRAHYAGFFDPGFGDNFGSHAVLEVRTSEVPFSLEDGQTIAKILYEKLNKIPSKTYGFQINSNYQNQNLALSKHFNILED
ncbi:MAG: Deoxycytidine triphosphate deaminase [Alphaproteobacteria bacterium MarineAlpha5_Bin9]|nr:MAG: Deoxycytidine triphosphate deaminase [Alphaproteobacteria bacterium MarineAlpha5_Bin9]|tara:strand:+ start:22608 stop:23693 length:1086 start_codon:yes stop_codon:yes gene_type:complete